MRKLPKTKSDDGTSKTKTPPAVDSATIKQNLKRRKLNGIDVEYITQERKYELITPLFGGGVEPKKNNLEQLINGKSIRGQLRFWWRACRGTGKLAEMKRNESAL